MACSGRIPAQDLPADPIAFVRQSAAEGILSLEQFREAARIHNEEDEASKQPRRKTSIGLLDVRSGEISPIPDAGLGTIPFDWSADGTRLLVGRADPSSRGLELHTWNRVSGAWVRVSRTSAGAGGGIADGPIRLAFAKLATRRDPAGGILIDTDAEGERRLPGGAAGSDPDVSPDGRSVVFTIGDARSAVAPAIVLATHGQAEPRALTRGSHPRFSRDGRFITFIRAAQGNTDVWLMRADGSAKRRITKTGYDEEFPALSPDGRFVVYSSARGDLKESHLYLTRVADGLEQELTHNGQSTRPIW